MKKRKLNITKIKKIMLLILIAIALIYIIVSGIKMMFKNDSKHPNVNVIDEVGVYTLDDNETSYYKNLFSNLKTELNKHEPDEKVYAKIIVQLFISDFFTLSNKINKNDIGGTQFVYNDYRNDFEKYAKESIYHTVKSNLYGNRNQTLPIVHSVDITNIVQKKYTYLDNTDSEAYYIDLEIGYEKDLGYQKSASLILIHNNDLLEIVKMTDK